MRGAAAIEESGLNSKHCGPTAACALAAVLIAQPPLQQHARSAVSAVNFFHRSAASTMVPQCSVSNSAKQTTRSRPPASRA